MFLAVDPWAQVKDWWRGGASRDTLHTYSFCRYIGRYIGICTYYSHWPLVFYSCFSLLFPKLSTYLDPRLCQPHHRVENCPLICSFTGCFGVLVDFNSLRIAWCAQDYAPLSTYGNECFLCIIAATSLPCHVIKVFLTPSSNFKLLPTAIKNCVYTYHNFLTYHAYTSI